MQIDILIMTLTKSHVFYVYYSDEGGKSFTPKENVMLSKSFIKISSDPIVGTDQARVQSWVWIKTKYHKMFKIINN
jgi:hypothetical protein